MSWTYRLEVREGTAESQVSDSDDSTESKKPVRFTGSSLTKELFVVGSYLDYGSSVIVQVGLSPNTEAIRAMDYFQQVGDFFVYVVPLSNCLWISDRECGPLRCSISASAFADMSEELRIAYIDSVRECVLRMQGVGMGVDWNYRGLYCRRFLHRSGIDVKRKRSVVCTSLSFKVGAHCLSSAFGMLMFIEWLNTRGAFGSSFAVGLLSQCHRIKGFHSQVPFDGWTVLKPVGCCTEPPESLEVFQYGRRTNCLLKDSFLTVCLRLCMATHSYSYESLPYCWPLRKVA